MGRPRSLLFGVGVNDSTHTVFEKGKAICPYYIRWRNMLNRVYGSKQDGRMIAYSKCSVHHSWLVFSNFKSWMEKQDWEGKELDKDLFSNEDGNYGPDTCCFLPHRVNSFMMKKRYGGVSKIRNGYSATVYDGKNRIYIGYYSDINSAIIACKIKRREIALSLVSEFSDEILKERFISKFVETDV